MNRPLHIPRRGRFTYDSGFRRIMVRRAPRGWWSVWLYVLIGVGLGAAVHGYAPQDLLLRWAGPRKPWAVPVAEALCPRYRAAPGEGRGPGP